MNVHDQLSFSLCSNKTKAAVKSLNLKAEDIVFVISDRNAIEFLIVFDDSTMLQCDMIHYSFFRGRYVRNQEFETPNCICVTSHKHKSAWSIKNMGVANWLYHLCEVFHHAKVGSLSIEYQQIDVGFIEPIQKVINGLPLLDLDFSDLSEKKEFQLKALEKFPLYEELFMNEDGFDKNEIDKIVIQNLTKLYISRANQININQLLLSNCEEFEFDFLFLTRKDLKRFFNMWIRGPNPRIKYFHVRFQPELNDGSLDEEIIFKNIKHTRIPLDSQEIQRRKMSDGSCEETKLSGGFKIKRVNGTCAVIVFIRQSFKFIVVE
ncbi:hypothetical protein CAEBREN_06584 [Caenorhabditis brenneri]|uniref:Sdz-33 F-box domain-containing protein n=1 Tax=Caenorhabditis brenneri TaxID=135651 RepID=G0MEW1_CAEBE|nr:hypothetical protein CAEBREN_06584 [Caenorhabditis brenneri]